MWQHLDHYVTKKTTQSLLEQNQKLRRFSESSADVSGNSSASLKQLWFTHSSFTEAVLKWVRTQFDGRCDQKALPDWHLANPTLSHLLIHLSGLVGVFSSVCSLFEHLNTLKLFCELSGFRPADNRKWLDLHQKLGRVVSACAAGKTLKSILVFIKLVFGDINWGIETHQMLSLWVQSPVGFLCSCVSVSWILYLVFYFGGWRCGDTNLVSGPDCEWRLSV